MLFDVYLEVIIFSAIQTNMVCDSVYCDASNSIRFAVTCLSAASEYPVASLLEQQSSAKARNRCNVVFEFAEPINSA
jgi:hypothetical protein